MTNAMDQIVEQYKVVPFFSTTIDHNLLHSSRGLMESMDAADESGINSSFRSD